MKRHLDYYTKSDQPLKDRSRFWTWYMRGLHGDMDTRFEGDRRLLGLVPSRSGGTVLVPEKIPVSVSKPRSLGDGLLFRPLQSDTYGYHPKGASFGRKSLPPYPTPGIEPITSGLPPLERPWKDWGTALKPLDDLVLNPKPLVSRAPIPRRRWIPPRLHHYDPELDDLLKRPLWRPRLFLDDDALLPSRSCIRDPWWWDFPELRPLDLALPWYRTPVRHSYLSPVKRTYLWGYHPMRPYGFVKF